MNFPFPDIWSLELEVLFLVGFYVPFVGDGAVVTKKA